MRFEAGRFRESTRSLRFADPSARSASADSCPQPSGRQWKRGIQLERAVRFFAGANTVEEVLHVGARRSHRTPDERFRLRPVTFSGV